MTALQVAPRFCSTGAVDPTTIQVTILPALPNAPALTPLVIGLGRPFPYISNLSLSLAVLLRDPESEVEIVARRVAQLGVSLELPEVPTALEEIQRVVTIFRELRAGLTEDGRTKLKSPTGTMSTAEAISVITSGLALAAHFGDGVLRPADVAAGLVGTVVKDPVTDAAVWAEYLEAVVRERRGWGDFYRACREVSG